MSWNPSIQFNKLYQAYLSLSTTALTNPMIANLNMNNFAINNALSVNAVSGSTLVLSADATQGIVVNTKMTIPNHTLVITNNTANDSFRVEDTGADTSTFRIDNDGQVAIRGDPATVLTNAFNVNGNSVLTGNISVSGTTTLSGVATAPTATAGDNTTQVATTAFVYTAISALTAKNPVRNTTMLNAIFNNPSVPIVLNNFGAGNPQTAITITLPSAFTGCTNFTFYIRAVNTQSTSTFTGGPVSFLVYPSRTLNGAWLSTDGAMGFTALSTNSSTTVNSIINTVWNWCPTSLLVSNTIYINLLSSSSTSPSSTTSVSYVYLDYDIVGTFATLA